jgi:hypothetical protein
LKNFKISSHYPDALPPDPLFNFLMKKLIKQLSKFKYLKCFLSHHALKFWLIFIYTHSFGELGYLWAKAQDFTWVNGDVYFHAKFNENLFPGTVQTTARISISSAYQDQPQPCRRIFGQPKEAYMCKFSLGSTSATHPGSLQSSNSVQKWSSNHMHQKQKSLLSVCPSIACPKNQSATHLVTKSVVSHLHNQR